MGMFNKALNQIESSFTKDGGKEYLYGAGTIIGATTGGVAYGTSDKNRGIKAGIAGIVGGAAGFFGAKYGLGKRMDQMIDAKLYTGGYTGMSKAEHYGDGIVGKAFTPEDLSKNLNGTGFFKMDVPEYGGNFYETNNHIEDFIGQVKPFNGSVSTTGKSPFLNTISGKIKRSDAIQRLNDSGFKSKKYVIDMFKDPVVTGSDSTDSKIFKLMNTVV